jgi:hypothetical protein
MPFASRKALPTQVTETYAENTRNGMKIAPKWEGVVEQDESEREQNGEDIGSERNRYREYRLASTAE